MKNSLIERMLKLEEKVNVTISLPGTTLSRVLLPEKGVGWSLGLGGLSCRKIFFIGKTIEDVIKQAEKYQEDL